MRLSRRNLTLGMALGGLLGPTLAAVSKTAYAAPSTGARRLIVFFTPNGTVHRHWRPTGGETSFSFAPGSILEPLAERRSDIVVCDGIDFHGFENHEPGMHGMLTGHPNAGMFGGASLDQFVASRLGAGSRFPSLEFGVMTSNWGASAQTRMSYSRTGAFVSPEDKPTEAFRRIFGDAMGPSASEDGKKKLLSRRQSIFDAVRGDLADLQKKVGAQEFRKVQEHVDAISDMEKSLFQPSVGGATCSAPKAPPELRVSDMAAFPALGKAQMDLLVLALQCNLTRVASIQWSHTVSPLLMSWLGLSEAHHELSHKDDSNVQGVANFVKAERWFAEQFGYFLEKMKATPDPAGGTLFDSSLILWVKELGDSRLHNGKSVPFILAGGASGRLKTGRYLNFNGASHKKLLASACQIMGVDTSGLGADGVAFTELTS